MPELQNELGPLKFELVGGQGGPETWCARHSLSRAIWTSQVVLCHPQTLSHIDLSAPQPLEIR